MAVPLISASFIQMAYSMTDMLWLGHLGSDAVAAAGAAGFFTWLCNALSFMTKIGAEITVSQSVGSKDYRRAAHYASQAITLSTTIGFIYACIIILAAPLLMGLFRFETSISTQAIDYMRLVAPGLFFQFNNNTFSGLYNGQGDSRTPFRTSAVGLIVNIILDPLLIYGIGPFPAWGTAGAAVATALAQLVVYGIFAHRIFSDRFPLGRMHLLSRLKQDYARRIILLGLPVSIQNALFSMFSLTLATLAARWGAVGVAAQSIGAQIEAISWMTAAGFSTALAAFTGQNYGAGNQERIRKGTRVAFAMSIGFSVMISVLVCLFAGPLMKIFVSGKEVAVIAAGVKYLRIEGAFYLGIGCLFLLYGYYRAIKRAEMSVVLTVISLGLRVLLAYVLSAVIGEVGIWVAIPIGWVMADVTGIVYMRRTW